MATQNGAIQAFFDLSARANMVNSIEANRAFMVQDEHAMGSWLIVPATAALFGGWSQSPSTRLNELAHLRPEADSVITRRKRQSPVYCGLKYLVRAARDKRGRPFSCPASLLGEPASPKVIQPVRWAVRHPAKR